MKRVLLLTDSLGCPREEIPVKKTWTDMILLKYAKNSEYYFYTECKHGLSVAFLDLDYIKEINPDLIICQLGIVDASRRAFPRLFIRFVSFIKPLSKIINRFARKYHKKLTRINNIHYATKEVFRKKLRELLGYAKKTIFISIAPPGKFLIDSVYNIENDVQVYNDILKKIAEDNNNCTIINPYSKETKTENYILSDGHHLNDYGEILVFNAIDDYLKQFEGND